MFEKTNPSSAYGIGFLRESNQKLKEFKEIENFLTVLVKTMKIEKFADIYKKRILSPDVKNKIFGSWGKLVYNLKFGKNNLPLFYFLEPEEPEYDSIEAAKRIRKNRLNYIEFKLPTYIDIDDPYRFTKPFFNQLISLNLEKNVNFQEWRKKTRKKRIFRHIFF